MPAAQTPVQPSNGSSALQTGAKSLRVASFQLNQNGLEAVGNPTFEEWLECGKFINRSNESVHFWIGDWLNYGEIIWGETYREAVSMFNFDIQTMRNDKWVAYKVPVERRERGLSFGHFETVASLEQEDQERYLDEAVEKKLSVQNLRQLIREQEGEKQKAKKVSRRQDTLLQDEQDNLNALQDARVLADQLLSKLDTIHFEKLSNRVKKEFFVVLSNVEHRCAGIEMEYGEDNE